MEMKELRPLFEFFSANTFMLIGRANHILYWNRLSRFCGKCVAATEMKTDERAKICPACGNTIYPRISPAVIVAIIKGKQILLAHARTFRENLHSVIAGFVEPGERLEDCIIREVFEEVGIKIRNIKYFGSQPWPFPDSLMIGYTAEYESGEIQADGVEITHADWYSYNDLPQIPTKDSIAGQMISWFVEKSK